MKHDEARYYVGTLSSAPSHGLPVMDHYVYDRLWCHRIVQSFDAGDGRGNHHTPSEPVRFAAATELAERLNAQYADAVQMLTPV